MRTLIGVTCVALALAMVAGTGDTSAAQKDEPKYTIKEVMGKAHKGKDALLNKVKGGKATDAEAKELLVMYEALAMNKPPKGDLEDFKKRAGALIEGAKLVVDGKKDDGIAKLNAAADCKGCHAVHKG